MKPKLTRLSPSELFPEADYKSLEERIAAQIVETRKDLLHPARVVSLGPLLRKRDRERIATTMRDAVEAVRPDRDPSVALLQIVLNAVHQGFVWTDLTVDICVALATFPAPSVSLPHTARVLYRAARFARMPALPASWGVWYARSRNAPPTTTTGRHAVRNTLQRTTEIKDPIAGTVSISDDVLK